MGLDAILNAKGRAMQANISRGCLTDWIVPYALHHLSEYTTVSDPLAPPQVRSAMAAESLGQHRPAGPQYVYWARSDEFNPIAEADALVARYCREGAQVDFHPLLGDHFTTLAAGEGGALHFLSDRFAGKPAPSTCGPEPGAAAGASRPGPTMHG